MASPPERYTRAYRIASPRYPVFDGGGAQRWGSRWCSPGHRVIHAAETYALAVLENLVHWQSNALPPSLVCIEVRLPHDLPHERVDPVALEGWNDSDYVVSRRAGDAWYQRGVTAVLWVPSVISPYECNVLINQTHADFARIETAAPIRAIFDPRLRPRPA